MTRGFMILKVEFWRYYFESLVLTDIQTSSEDRQTDLLSDRQDRLASEWQNNRLGGKSMRQKNDVVDKMGNRQTSN